MESNRGNVIIAALVFVALALTTAGGLYFLQTRPSQPPAAGITQEPYTASTNQSEAVTTPTGAAATVSQPTVTSPTVNETTSWKAYKFSTNILLKLPPSVKEPLSVNAGNYAKETMLPGGTRLQIYGGDGARPTGQPLNYATITSNIVNNQTFTKRALRFAGVNATEFASTALQATMIQGGETYAQVRGVLLDTNLGALAFIHYNPATARQLTNFSGDEQLFNQVLSTLRLPETGEDVAGNDALTTTEPVPNTAEVKMTISPDEGPAGTTVSITVTGLPRTTRQFFATLHFRDSTGHFGESPENPIYDLNQSKIDSNATIRLAYKIPTTVLTAAFPDAQNPSKPIPTASGTAFIILLYENPVAYQNKQPSERRIEIPFIIKPN